MMVMTIMLTFLMIIIMTMTLIRNLKVLDGLLPVTSKAVDDTRGQTVHKPVVFTMSTILTGIVILMINS